MTFTGHFDKKYGAEAQMERGQPIYTSAKHNQSCPMPFIMQLNHYEYLVDYCKYIFTLFQLKD